MNLNFEQCNSDVSEIKHNVYLSIFNWFGYYFVAKFIILSEGTVKGISDLFTTRQDGIRQAGIEPTASCTDHLGLVSWRAESSSTNGYIDVGHTTSRLPSSLLVQIDLRQITEPAVPSP